MDADKTQIQRTLGALFESGDTIEVRCVGNGKTISGYFRDQDKLTDVIERLNSDFNPQQNVYLSLNSVDPGLYARRADDFGFAAKGQSTSDANVPNRRWLLIDVDPLRPSGVSATDQQKQSAIRVAEAVYAFLQDRFGGDCIVCADSGNGAHLLVRLPDVPADDHSRFVCEQLLQLLDQRFSNPQAKIDTTTFNAARIVTAYGTIKRKGTDIPEQRARSIQRTLG